MRMRKSWIALGLWFSAAAHAAPSSLPSVRLGMAAAGPDAELALPAIDQAKLLDEDRGRVAPLPYAYTRGVALDLEAGRVPTIGRWEPQKDGSSIWRATVRAPGAVSLDLGFERLFLPHGAALYLTNDDGSVVRGPYTDADLVPGRGFWTPYVPGDVARLEIVAPTALAAAVVVDLARVNHGYRALWDLDAIGAKSYACEIDVACSDADLFRSQVRAVARYTFQSGNRGLLCTGQLLNNASGDRRRLFHTAAHCISTPAEAQSLVLYWNYQSPTCRPPGSEESGTPLSTSIATVQTGGANLLMTFPGSDATLTELATAIPDAAQPYFNGWDRRLFTPVSTAVIHQPDGDEKRISLDFDAPRVSTAVVQIPGGGGAPPIVLDAGSALLVSYDRGTTEGGSSGAGLLTPQGRVIGHLSGGGDDPTCTGNITDYYGRIATSWDGGGSANSRLRDWLDPAGSGAEFLDGRENCAVPTVTLTGPGTATVGTPSSYTVAATGAGPFTVQWDVDADGKVDRSQSGVAANSSLSVNYPGAGSLFLRVRVTDATGCAAEQQRAVVVNGPSLSAGTIGAPQQLCGNNDADIDPGERWQVPVTLANATGADALRAGYAVFAQALGGAPRAIAGPDAFGYTASDDSTGCGYQFIDLEGQVDALALTATATGATPNDDGRSTPVAITSFPFYTESPTSLVMSTNGYLSTVVNESGADFDNGCGLTEPDNGSSGARINVLHDDLVVGAQANAGLRAREFPVCPRRSDTQAGDSACIVFQWSHMGQYTSASAAPVGDATFQAVLYPATGQIVYQYRNPTNDAGDSASVGIQNANVTQGLEYSCNAPVVNAGRAVCLFRPGFAQLPPPDAKVRLENPAIELPAELGAGQSATVNVRFATLPDGGCGGRVNLRYVGALDDDAASLAPATLLNTTLGGGNACQVQACTATLAPVALADGLYYNAARAGNGEGVFTIPSGNNQIFFSAWFTGEPDREPTWYIVQGTVAGNQVVAPILKFAQNTAAPTFTASSTLAGVAEATFISPTRYAYTWNLDGTLGGQLETRLYARTPATTPNRTGLWYYPAESGWGQVLDDHLLGANPEQVVINYLYDGAGQPRWTLAGTPNLSTGTVEHGQFLVHCPSCPNLTDFGVERRAAGSQTRDFTGVTTGVLSSQLQFQPPLAGTWVRVSIPIQMLSAPQPQ